MITDNVLKYESMKAELDDILNSKIKRPENVRLTTTFQIDGLKDVYGSYNKADLFISRYIPEVLNEYFDIIVDRAIKKYEFDVNQLKTLVTEELDIIRERLHEDT